MGSLSSTSDDASSTKLARRSRKKLLPSPQSPNTPTAIGAWADLAVMSSASAAASLSRARRSLPLDSSVVYGGSRDVVRSSTNSRTARVSSRLLLASMGRPSSSPQATAVTPAVWPVNTAGGSPVAGSHNRTVLSELPLASTGRPSSSPRPRR